MAGPLFRIVSAAGFVFGLLSPGALAQVSADPSFASGGLASAGLATSNERWHHLLVQADGKIVVAGARETSLLSGNGGLFVARYLATGAVDASFNIGSTLGLRLPAAKHVVALPDGKILLVGDASIQTLTDLGGLTIAQSATQPADIVIVRLTADGSLDTAFGDGGVVRTDFGGIETAERVLHLPGGKLWVIGAGSSMRGTQVTDWQIVGYNADGSLDAEVGQAGRIRISFGSSLLSASPFDAVLHGHKVVIAGTSGHEFVVARVNLAGELDPGFGDGGLVRIADSTGLPGATLRAVSVVALPDGRYFTHGNFSFFSSDEGRVSAPLVFATRLLADGRQDPTFNAFAPYRTVTAPAAGGVAVWHGRLLLGLGTHQLMALNDDGSADTAFDPSGLFTPLTGQADRSVFTLQTLAVQPDGLLLASGSTLQATGGISPYQSDGALFSLTSDGTTVPALPTAPSELAATALRGPAVLLRWRDNASNEDGYAVERASTPAFTNSSVVATLPASTVQFTDSRVTVRTTYHYRVVARNAQGSAASQPVAVTIGRR